MQLLTRLNLRQSWPLVVAGIVLIGTLSVFSGSPYKFSQPLPFDIHSTINYSDLLTHYGGFPLIRVILIMLIAILLFFATRTGASTGKKIVSAIALLTCVILCGACVSNFMNGDGTSLSPIQTLRLEKTTYQLARARTLDSGLISDGFWVFRCEFDDTQCLYVEDDGKQSNPVMDGDTPEQSAKLTVDPTTNALYLQINDAKTLIAK